MNPDRLQRMFSVRGYLTDFKDLMAIKILCRSYHLNVEVFDYFYQTICTSESCLKLESKLLFPGSL